MDKNQPPDETRKFTHEFTLEEGKLLYDFFERLYIIENREKNTSSSKRTDDDLAKEFASMFVE